MNYSKQRELILQTVTRCASHMSAEEVYQALHSEHFSLSLGTVYRNLNQLSANGMLQKIPVSNGGDRFDHRLDEHYHLICDSCGRVYDIELPNLSLLLEETTAKTGFVLSGCDFLLHGVCPECVSEKQHKGA